MRDAPSQESGPVPVSRSGTALQDEQRGRWLRGDCVLVEDLLREHPGFENNAEALLELLYNEVLLREQDGQSPRLEEYVKRFPHLADPLKDQFEVHQALESAGALASSTFVESSPKVSARPRAVVPVTSASLTSSLRRYQLLKTAQLVELAGLEARFPDPKEFVGELIRQGWLTPYQANQLLLNKAQDLVLGSHILLERLGEGGMGLVFKARQRKLNRIVAIKLIRKERLENPDAVKRFQREVQAVSALSHPHIVRAYDADEIGGTHLLVMEYCEGATDLARLVMKTGPLPLPQACEAIRQAALGLQHAFERGLVHRDIKPHNLLVAGPDKVVKILDMGLARLDTQASEDSKSTMTYEGMVMGTPDYIAPEQARESHTVDIRADLYSLGCTFYYLLTGRVPFPGGTFMEKINKHHFDEPTPLRTLRPGIPVKVVAVVTKLMAKKPEDRFQTPVELAQTLTALGSLPEEPIRDKRKPARGKHDGDRHDTFASALSYIAKRGDTVAFEWTEGQKAPTRHWLPYTLAGGAVALIGVLVVLLLMDSSSLEDKPEKKKSRPLGGGDPPRIRHKVDEAWLKQVQAMPTEEQMPAVVVRLKELNPNFDGKVTHASDRGAVTELQFFTDDVTDISPVRALESLQKLECFGSNWGKGMLDDLSPLEGLKLATLDCGGTKVADLDPLKGMPLHSLACSGTPVKDLSPLAGMPLTMLSIDGTQVTDLTPLKDLKLTTLRCAATKVANLIPLKSLPLQELHCDLRLDRDAPILRFIKTLKTINGKPRDEVLR